VSYTRASTWSVSRSGNCRASEPSKILSPTWYLRLLSQLSATWTKPSAGAVMVMASISAWILRSSMSAWSNCSRTTASSAADVRARLPSRSSTLASASRAFSRLYW